MIDFDAVENIVILDIDMNDYPKFCDAYIESCDINGVPADEEQIDAINQNGSFVNQQVMEHWCGD